MKTKKKAKLLHTFEIPKFFNKEDVMKIIRELELSPHRSPNYLIYDSSDSAFDDFAMCKKIQIKKDLNKAETALIKARIAADDEEVLGFDVESQLDSIILMEVCGEFYTERPFVFGKLTTIPITKISDHSFKNCEVKVVSFLA